MTSRNLLSKIFKSILSSSWFSKPKKKQKSIKDDISVDELCKRGIVAYRFKESLSPKIKVYFSHTDSLWILSADSSVNSYLRLSDCAHIGNSFFPKVFEEVKFDENWTAFNIESVNHVDELSDLDKPINLNKIREIINLLSSESIPDKINSKNLNKSVLSASLHQKVSSTKKKLLDHFEYSDLELFVQWGSYFYGLCHQICQTKPDSSVASLCIDTGTLRFREDGSLVILTPLQLEDKKESAQ